MRNKIKKEILRENEKIIPNFIENIFWAVTKDFQEKFRDKKYMT